ncbi:MAG: glycosyltransferase, partial [Myxococcales bacterium]|nr:glycosyltransferase [Myxococcales bacterium]
VVDNGSRDRTREVASSAGAIVIDQPERGYGAACLKGIEYLSQDPPDVLVFVDGDYSDYPEELDEVIAPIVAGEAELVIGSRILGGAPSDALMPQARFGNWLSCHLIRVLYGVRFTDLGPFRAITWSALERIGMADRNYGWTVEMQVKAAKLGIRSTEVPVKYRPRIGKSKVSGTVKGSVLAGHKILWTIFSQWKRAS